MFSSMTKFEIYNRKPVNRRLVIHSGYFYTNYSSKLLCMLSAIMTYNEHAFGKCMVYDNFNHEFLFFIRL